MFDRRQFLVGFAALSAVPVLPARAATAPLKFVATTGMVADLVRQIGGDSVDVQALMGPGVDPHAYRQTRSDIVAMTRADVVFWHGLYLEAQMERFFNELKMKRPVVAVADSLDPDLLLAHADYSGRFDPHVWMDPSLWSRCADIVVETLSDIQPGSAAFFEENAERFRVEAEALGDYAADILSRVPQESRVLVTAHDAFGYFGRAYGFQVEGIQGISTESEAGLNRVGELVDLLVARGIGAVFVETSVSERNVRALIEGAAAQGQDVRVGGALYSDAMGIPGTYEGTWFGMIDHNVTTIAAALGADVPSGGRLGKLGS